MGLGFSALAVFPVCIFTHKLILDKLSLLSRIVCPSIAGGSELLNLLRTKVLTVHVWGTSVTSLSTSSRLVG
jgi:hypothetical protein